MESSVRVRFAPSPTGDLHLGSALTALANHAFARAHGGVLVLRIDDTDRARSSPEFVESLLDTLAWLGVDVDEGPRFQSKRDTLYEAQVSRLIADERAYHCFCDHDRLERLATRQREGGEPPRYDGRCRDLDPDEVSRRLNLGEPAVVRMRVLEVDHDFDDAIRGSVAAPPGSFGDFILRRADGTFGYLFASACDDIDLAITHVIRGEDHLPNTPRQIAVFHAFGAALPAFAHLPLLLGPDGRKLSKRDPLGSVDDLCRVGYLPRTVRRYLNGLLGHGQRDPLEPPGELDLSRVPATSPHVDAAQLAALGREDVAAMPIDELSAALALRARGDGGVDVDRGIGSGDTAARVGLLLDDLRRDCATIGDVAAALDAIVARPPAAARHDDPRVLAHARMLLTEHDVEQVDQARALVAALRAFARDAGLGVRDVLQPVRVALTGADHGPALELVLHALGTGESLLRIERAAAAREGASASPDTPAAGAGAQRPTTGDTST